MDLTDVMRTTFSCREWTDEAVTDDQIEEIIELARFAPSGGNRQPARVVAVRDAETKQALRRLGEPTMRVYFAQTEAGEAPWNTVHPTMVDVEAIWNRDEPVEFLQYVEDAPVLLCIGADLGVIASFDSHHQRVGLISGASIYPFAWNILLAARNLGLAGVLTTMCAGSEGEAERLLGFPPEVALAAVIPLGRPVRQLTKLRRAPVDEILRYERWSDA